MKLDHDAIETAAAAFREACAEEKRLRVPIDYARLDARIAERDGDAEAENTAKEDERKATSVWARAYTTRQEAAETLVAALQIDRASLKSALI